MIAALYVQTGGSYFGLDGVDPWDETRRGRRAGVGSGDAVGYVVGMPTPSGLSGPSWCVLFPTSRSVDDLDPAWAPKVAAFLAALEAAGAVVRISTTRRPRERALLMRGAWDIAREGVKPAAVQVVAGVDIDWTHGGDTRAAVAAAAAMVAKYGLVHKPSRTSRHIEGKAIDVRITWHTALEVVDGLGVRRALGSANGATGQDETLYSIGASYGVVKLRTDPPHWSTDGR